MEAEKQETKTVGEAVLERLQTVEAKLSEIQTALTNQSEAKLAENSAKTVRLEEEVKGLKAKFADSGSLAEAIREAGLGTKEGFVQLASALGFDAEFEEPEAKLEEPDKPPEPPPAPASDIKPEPATIPWIIK